MLGQGSFTCLGLAGSAGRRTWGVRPFRRGNGSAGSCVRLWGLRRPACKHNRALQLRGPRLRRPAVRYYTQSSLRWCASRTAAAALRSGGCRSGGAGAPPALLAGFAFSGAYAPRLRDLLGRNQTEDCGLHRLRQHRNRRQDHPRRAISTSAPCSKRIKERGEVVTKIAYGDWKRAGDYSRSLTQHAIQHGAAQPDARRRQERRRHQPRARRARDGVHPQPHQRLRHRRRRQRLHRRWSRS